MGFTKVFFATVFAAVLGADAMPYPLHSQHSTHRKREVNGQAYKFYHPAPQFTTYGEGKPLDNPQSLVQMEDLKATTMSWLGKNTNTTVGWRTGIPASDDSDIAVGYVHQVHNNVSFANAVANVAFTTETVVSFGHSFVPIAQMPPSTPKVSTEDAIRQAEKTLGGQHNSIDPSLQYLARPDGSASLVHIVQVQNHVDGSHREAYVDAHSGDVLSVVDFVADASFNGLHVDRQSIPDGLELIKDPEDLDASPNGWNNDGTTATTDTTGNNAFVAKLINNGQAQELTQGTGSGADLTFDFTYDPNKDPTDANNVNAARVNAFYIANTVHDIMYRYGFTEKAFNFQANNFGKGGAEQDPVEMSVQDPSGTNNANFATPPDGQPGVCRMFIFDLRTPRQDGAMENDIPIHELIHGVSDRMTGGGTGRCLQSLESGGMGEGWSDAVADWLAQKTPKIEDFVLAQFASGKPGGLRSAPYSVNPSVNPLKYSDIGKLQEVHQIGEVWANTLHNVYADLVASLGFNANAKADANGKEGNIVFMKLIMKAFTLQPCNPTVLAARDAIIQADKTLFNGANECTLRKAFAKKGLGLKATADFKDDESVPANCQ